MLRWSARSRAPLAGFARLATLLAALAASSCSSKKIVVDPTTELEGTPSASQLVVYPDVPLTTYVMDDTLGGHRATCSDDDTLLATFEERATDASTVHGLIMDFTPAGTYQVFRDDGSSFRLLKDYLLQPVKRWPYGQTEAYEFLDPRPQPFPFQTYVARGVVEGAVTPDSPITNIGKITAAPTASILYTGRTNICGDLPGPGEAPPDSLLPMSWSAVSGAAGYWVHVYQFATGADFLGSRFPAPANLGRTVDYFMAFFPASVTSYKIGDPLPPGARIITKRTLLNNTDYAVRITAVNAEGQLIAYPSQSAHAFFVTRDPNVETRYFVRTLGAFVVHTGNLGTCARGFGTCPVPIPASLPSVKVFPTTALPLALR